MTMPVQGGQEGARGAHLIELAKTGPLQRVTGVWGGYQDAGDWDTVGGHLSATYDLLPAGPTGTYWAQGVLIGSTLHRIIRATSNRLR